MHHSTLFHDFRLQPQQTQPLRQAVCLPMDQISFLAKIHLKRIFKLLSSNFLNQSALL